MAAFHSSQGWQLVILQACISLSYVSEPMLSYNLQMSTQNVVPKSHWSTWLASLSIKETVLLRSPRIQLSRRFRGVRVRACDKSMWSHLIKPTDDWLNLVGQFRCAYSNMIHLVFGCLGCWLCWRKWNCKFPNSNPSEAMHWTTEFP